MSAGNSKTYILQERILSKMSQALGEEFPTHQTQKEPLHSGRDREVHVKGINREQMSFCRFLVLALEVKGCDQQKYVRV